MAFRFRFYSQKLAFSGWYLRLYSLKGRQRRSNELFVLLTMSICEFSMEIFYSLFYMQHALCHLCFHTKAKKLRAPWFDKTILSELHWNLSIVTYFCLSQWMWLFVMLLIFSLLNQTHLSESEFLQDLHSKTMFHVRYVTSGYWNVY